MDSSDLNSLLNQYSEDKVKIHKKRQQAIEVWEPHVQEILKHVKNNDPEFSFQEFPMGSYYDRTKVKNPNEFDILLIAPRKLCEYNSPTASLLHLLVPQPKGFRNVELGGNLTNAATIRSHFANRVSEAIRYLNKDRFISVTMSSTGPAVTLEIGNQKYSVDLTLAYEVNTWPEEAQEWITRPRNGWPSQSLIEEIVEGGHLLVPKNPKPVTYDNSTEDFCNQHFWSISFVAAEKKLMLKGGHGEPGNCSKNVLRILKSLREKKKMNPLTSYHLKTIMFYEREENPHPSLWTEDQLATRFQSALTRLLRCLRNRKCPHYFIKDINLFDEDHFKDLYDKLICKITSILQNPQNKL